MKRLILSALIFLSATTSANEILFHNDLGPTPSDMTLRGNAMSVEIGTLHLARPRIHMRNGSIGIGAKVVTDGMDTGRITAYFPKTGFIAVDQGSREGTHQYKIHELAATNGCNGALCVGDSVFTARIFGSIFSGHIFSGRIAGFFADGDIVVDEGDRYGLARFNPRSVGPAFGCASNFCVGDRVMLSANSNEGTIDGFFPNGDLLIGQGDREGQIRLRSDEVVLLRATCQNITIQRVEICGKRF